MDPIRDVCFACGRKLGKKVPHLVDTRDAQLVYVGIECFRLVQVAGDKGYQPPKGGPRLYPLPELTEHQRWMLAMCEKGAGIDASPGAMTVKQRREADQLVERGLLEKAKNYSGDRHGMYCKPSEKKGKN